MCSFNLYILRKLRSKGQKLNCTQFASLNSIFKFFSSLVSGFAKKTLMKTAKAAGLKPSKGGKRHKYVFPNNNSSSSNSKAMTSPGRMSLAQMTNMDLSNEDLPHDDDLSSELTHINCGLLYYTVFMYYISCRYIISSADIYLIMERTKEFYCILFGFVFLSLFCR